MFPRGPAVAPDEDEPIESATTEDAPSHKRRARAAEHARLRLEVRQERREERAKRGEIHDPRRIVGEERAICVGLRLAQFDREECEESLEELAALAESSGAKVVQRVLQTRPRVDGRTYIGAGKAEELKQMAADEKANVLVFDHDLSPAQSRNLEKITDLKILDRTELILDIFARRARTPTAKTQVEVAQLEYFLPRLPHLWSHLSRTGGGIGTRGPGETQLEVDRRRIRTRLSALKSRLEGLGKRFEVQRGLHAEAFRVALVGYTNVGKSAILNRLTFADVESHDRLFETLDATTRILPLGSGTNATLTDTVGFVRKLPHSLVESFRATLAEVAAADLLLHVMDAPHPQGEVRREAVRAVLHEIEAHEIPEILVYNKCDLLSAEAREGLARQTASMSNAVMVSARTGAGLADLQSLIRDRLQRDWIHVEGEIPASESELFARLTRVADVRRVTPRDDDSLAVEARVAPGEWARLRAQFKDRAPRLFHE